MTFSMYALLKEGAKPHSVEELMTLVETEFAGSEGLSAHFKIQPFARSKSIRLAWEDRAANLRYDEDSETKQDVQETATRLGKDAPEGIAEISRYIYAFFASDPDRNHSTQIVDLIQFLQQLDGALVFDPEQNRLMNS